MEDQITKLSRLLNRPLTLLQLGAGDGYGLGGILPDLLALQAAGVDVRARLLEPVTEHRNQLQAGIDAAGLENANVAALAVTVEGGPTTLHYIKPALSALAPEWLQTLSATDATLFMIPTLPAQATASEEVKAIALADLLESVEPDVLLLDWHTDALPPVWRSQKPMIIRLLARPEDRSAVMRYFQRIGYRVTPQGEALHCWLLPKMALRRSDGCDYLHHIWLGDNAMAEDQANWTYDAPLALDERTHKVWNDADAEELLPSLMAPELCLRRDVPVGMRADVLRYNLMRLFGGVYLDTDFQVLRSFEDLLIPGCLHYAEEIPGRPAIGFLQSAKGHPFWDFLLVRMAALLPRKPENQWDIVQLTGPGAFARALAQWVTHLRKVTIYDAHGPVGTHWPEANVVAFFPRAFYPYYYGPKEKARYDAAVAAAGGDVQAAFPGAYAIHHWAAGWLAEATPKQP